MIEPEKPKKDKFSEEKINTPEDLRKLLDEMGAKDVPIFVLPEIKKPDDKPKPHPKSSQ